MINSEQLYQTMQRGKFIIAGPCVLESLDLALEVADKVADAAAAAGLFVIFKSSFDKANRTSVNSFRGPGIEWGLEWLAEIKEKTKMPILTDIHTEEQAAIAAQVADVLQIPAFLCRQTSLLMAAGKTGRVINIKKGQFVSPYDMQPATNKVIEGGSRLVALTERGTFFGYNNLVVDFRSLAIMREFAPVIFDATHSVQLPGAQGGASGGERRFVPALARAAVAAGVDGVFLETHPNPDKALCDGPNSWPLDKLTNLFQDLKAHWSVEHAC
ncbi:MAG: 3-deoxy-8-phosphooctulonate synthase [Desulfovibrionaceae bacterium]|nr:3-deoxy-8-phosphooctulonate synthase [Desulfovibrionaceae bacterium]